MIRLSLLQYIAVKKTAFLWRIRMGYPMQMAIKKIIDTFKSLEKDFAVITKTIVKAFSILDSHNKKRY